MIKETKKDVFIAGIIGTGTGLFIILMNIIKGEEFFLLSLGILMFLLGINLLLKYFSLFSYRIFGIKIKQMLLGIYLIFVIVFLYNYFITHYIR